MEGPEVASGLDRLCGLHPEGPLVLMTATSDLDLSQASVVADVLVAAHRVSCLSGRESGAGLLLVESFELFQCEGGMGVGGTGAHLGGDPDRLHDLRIRSS